MIQAYSRLRCVLDKRDMTVPALHRLICQRGEKVNIKSLYRLSKDHVAVDRLDLRVAWLICEICRVPLSELVVYEKPPHRLRRLAASKQKRLDTLMSGNNDGTLTTVEQGVAGLGPRG